MQGSVVGLATILVMTAPAAMAEPLRLETAQLDSVTAGQTINLGPLTIDLGTNGN